MLIFEEPSMGPEKRSPHNLKTEDVRVYYFFRTNALSVGGDR
jgi:hypothetical protein